jgi:DNA-directed RNA polymerase subunit RPC12/RpoP
MEDFAAEQDAIRCPRCGGQSAFVPQARALVCQSCGHSRDLTDPDRDRAARRETAYDPGRDDDVPRAEPHVSDGARLHACTACGGQVVFTGQAMSENCPYCNGAVVLGPEEAAYETMGLIPFAIDEPEALTQARDWIARRLAAPGDLRQAVSEGRLAGLYAPFWTFDSDEAVTYWARYNERSGKNTRVRNVSGSFRTRFDDLLVPASPHVTALIRDGILHDFRPGDLRAFRAGYLAGFAAERHHQTVAEGLRMNDDDKALLIRNRIKAHEGRRDLYDIGYRTDTTGIHYRRILLPVWILHYRHRDRPYRVVVSGIDGRTFGERPFSVVKLALYSAAITAAAIAFGLVWGAAGFL